MPASKQKSLRVLERRTRVSRMYLAEVPQFVIAEREGVDPATISRDLAALGQQWQERAVNQFAARKNEELAKINQAAAEAWAAWDRSCQPEETMHAGKTSGRIDRAGKKLPDLEKSYKTVRGQAGDPRFLETYLKCVERSCKLLGIDADTPTVQVNVGGGPSLDQLARLGAALADFPKAREIAANILIGEQDGSSKDQRPG